ncbi:MAG: hypothetical protein A3F67_11805 [Verrucomicrobia bacterium RIFCSPHIGHO2_12_FULL_41_10]|nr:MAG: hypothetical protein A3F67_11805 [Verrucomicrobia bacterium RIFCSPHIGHO2_12_FULL_41_10]HLB57391.1 hypothetical protein [Gammaproteobacteria bacterium]
MKTVNLNIAYPDYFKTEKEKSELSNYNLLLSRGLSKEEAEKISKIGDFDAKKTTVESIFNALSYVMSTKLKNAADFKTRKIFAKIVEKLYSVEKDESIEFSDEQFDFIFEALNGENVIGTALVYVQEEFERLKLTENKE